MNNEFLVEWNDEYLDIRIVSGPFAPTEREKYLKEELIRQIKENEGVSDAEAEVIYKNKKMVTETEDNEVDLYPEIGLHIWTDDSGASYVYNSGYESHLKVTEYNIEPKIEVVTPAETIKVKRTYDDEYPGVSVLLDSPGEPGAIFEYDPVRSCFVIRVYSFEDSEGDPAHVIELKKEE